MEGLNQKITNTFDDVSSSRKEKTAVFTSIVVVIAITALLFIKETSPREKTLSSPLRVEPSTFFTNSGDAQRDAVREDRVGRLFRGQLPRLDMHTINEENKNLKYS